MLSYIKNECKRQFKSKRYISCLFIMSLAILILFQLFSSMSNIEGFKREESLLMNNDLALVQTELYNIDSLKELSTNGISSYSIKESNAHPPKMEDINMRENELRVFEKVANEEAEAFRQGDMQTYMEKAMEFAYYLHLSNADEMSFTDYTIWSTDPNYNSAMKVASNYNFPKVNFQIFRAAHNEYGRIYGSLNRFQSDFGYFKMASTRILYYDALLKSGHTPVNMYQVDSISIVYQTFRMIFPMAIPLLVIFLFFDQYDNDQRLGTTKTILSLPNGRRLYTLGSLISNIIVLLSILLIPLLLFMIVLGIKDGFSMWNLPVFADTYYISPTINPTNIGPMNVVYKTNTSGLFNLSHLGLSQVSNYNINFIPPGGEGGPTYWGQLSGVDPNRMIMSTRLGITTLGTVILRSTILIILFAITLILIIFLLNILLEKKMTVLITALAIFILLQVLSPESSTMRLVWFNPFHFRNAIYTVCGFTSYSFILGLTSTLLCTSLFSIGSFFYMSKKDIT